MAKGLLEANGIRSSFAGGIFSTEFVPNPFGVPQGVVLQVAHKDLKQATKLLGQAHKHHGETETDREWREQKKPIYKIRKFLIYLILGGCALIIVLGLLFGTK